MVASARYCVEFRVVLVGVCGWPQSLDIRRLKNPPHGIQCAFPTLKRSHGHCEYLGNAVHECGVFGVGFDNPPTAAGARGRYPRRSRELAGAGRARAAGRRGLTLELQGKFRGMGCRRLTQALSPGWWRHRTSG